MLTFDKHNIFFNFKENIKTSAKEKFGVERPSTNTKQIIVCTVCVKKVKITLIFQSLKSSL